MHVTLWGTRGSVAAAGPDTAHYGGNTCCVEVRSDDGDTVLVLDAGTGIRRLGASLAARLRRVDLLLTHLHMDHIQGLGFFAPLYVPGLEVHIWGPSSTRLGLRTRLGRYMSPPLFPVRLRDLPCNLSIHELPGEPASIGPFTVQSSLVCHPGPTVGFRITAGTASLAYLPDHEPALGLSGALGPSQWTSGYALAADADLLIHDAQYTDAEYEKRVGWGHCTLRRAIEFAALARVRKLILFHHDPEHDDVTLAGLVESVLEHAQADFGVVAGAEGMNVHLPEN